MTAEELRDLDVEALDTRARELDDELFRLRIQQAMGQLDQPGRLQTTRRDLARVKTIRREKAK